MKCIYLAPLYAKATEALRHSTQLSSTRNRTQAYRSQDRLGSSRPVAHCTSQYSYLVFLIGQCLLNFVLLILCDFAIILVISEIVLLFNVALKYHSQDRPSKPKPRQTQAKATILKAKATIPKVKATVVQSQSRDVTMPKPAVLL